MSRKRELEEQTEDRSGRVDLVQQPTAKRQHTADGPNSPSQEHTYAVEDRDLEGLSNALAAANTQLASWQRLFAMPTQPSPTIAVATKAYRELQASVIELEAANQELALKECGLTIRLADKDAEVHELTRQLQASGQAVPTPLAVDSPADLECKRLREKLKATKVKLRAATDELDARPSRAQPNNTGRKLLEKCKQLQAENEELGKQLSEGVVSQLRAENALLRELQAQLKASLQESNDNLRRLDEEVRQMHLRLLAMSSAGK